LLGVIIWIDGQKVSCNVASKEKLNGEGEKKFFVHGVRDGMGGVREFKFVGITRCKFLFWFSTFLRYLRLD